MNHYKILSNQKIASNIYDMRIKAEDIASLAKPGQFVNLYSKEQHTILPRPISICEIDQEEGTLRMVYAAVGTGTKYFGTLQKGDTIEVTGPMGNGFMIDEEEGHHVLVGGGIGVPPLLEVAKQLRGKKTVILGFRSEPILIEAFQNLGADVHVATEDGSCGMKGNVIELMEQQGINGDIIYSCGPKRMLEALSKWGQDKSIPVQVSLEERMGCGLGACVGCVCKIKVKSGDDWEYKKVCKDGPVFWGNEVEWNE